MVSKRRSDRRSKRANEHTSVICDLTGHPDRAVMGPEVKEQRWEGRVPQCALWEFIQRMKIPSLEKITQKCFLCTARFKEGPGNGSGGKEGKGSCGDTQRGKRKRKRKISSLHKASTQGGERRRDTTRVEDPMVSDVKLTR